MSTRTATATRPAYNPAGLPPAVADMAVAAAARKWVWVDPTTGTAFWLNEDTASARQQARGGLLFPPARVGGAL